MKKQHVDRLFDVIYNSRSRIFAVTKEPKDDAKRYLVPSIAPGSRS